MPRATAPYQRHSETSKAAAREIIEKLGKLEREVYDALKARGLRGATDQQLQYITGLKESTQRPRRVRLVELGLVYDSGERRQTHSGRSATVWCAW